MCSICIHKIKTQKYIKQLHYFTLQWMNILLVYFLGNKKLVPKQILFRDVTHF